MFKSRAVLLLLIAVSISLSATESFCQYLPLTGDTLTGPLTLPTLNKVVYADQEPGADGGTKISNCLSVLASAGGGVCDARGFGPTTQIVSTQIYVGADGVSEVLVLDPSTQYEPSTATTNMLRLGKNGQIFNLNVQIPSFGLNVYSGQVINISEYVGLSSRARIEGLNIDAHQEPGTGVTGGYGIYVDSESAANQIAFLNIQHFRILGLEYGLYLLTNGTGYINGNHFGDGVLSGNEDGIVLNAASAGAGGGIQGNTFQVDIEAALGTGIDYLGVNLIQNNIFYSKIWDTSVPVTNTSNSNAVPNLFVGSTDSVITDRAAGVGSYPYQNIYMLAGVNNGLSVLQTPYALVNGSLAWVGARDIAAVGWDASEGQGEADYYTGVNTGANNCAHEWWTPNSSSDPTEWQSLGCIYNDGTANFSGYRVGGTPGYTGTKTMGACSWTVQGRIITGVSGC